MSHVWEKKRERERKTRLKERGERDDHIKGEERLKEKGERAIVGRKTKKRQEGEERIGKEGDKEEEGRKKGRAADECKGKGNQERK